MCNYINIKQIHKTCSIPTPNKHVKFELNYVKRKLNYVCFVIFTIKTI